MRYAVNLLLILSMFGLTFAEASEHLSVSALDSDASTAAEHHHHDHLTEHNIDESEDADDCVKCCNLCIKLLIIGIPKLPHLINSEAVTLTGSAFFHSWRAPPLLRPPIA